VKYTLLLLDTLLGIMPQSNNNLPLYVAGPSPEITLNIFRKQDEEAQTLPEDPAPPGARSSLKSWIASKYAGLWDTKFPSLFSIFIGCAIIAGSTYGVSRNIQRDIDERCDKINSKDPQIYIEIARNQFYDVCYSGCKFCDSEKYNQRACARTAKLNVPGVICDGNLLRNSEDRYPAACLEAMAESYKGDLFRQAKNNANAQYLFVIFFVLAGFVGWGISYGLLYCYFKG
jgi:hypothetical protein